MILNIGNREYELRYGIKFIETLDRLYKQDLEGIEFGLGIEMAVPYLNMQRPTALMNVIKAGTAHLNSQPSNSDIETFLEELATNDIDKYEELYKEAIESMEQSPFLKSHVKRVLEGS